MTKNQNKPYFTTTSHHYLNILQFDTRNKAGLVFFFVENREKKKLKQTTVKMANTNRPFKPIIPQI